LKIAFVLLSILLAAIQLAAQDSHPPQSAANANQSSPAPDVQQPKSKAAAQLQQQEHQRILGIMPNFNTSNIHNAAPLSPEQKFQLAAKSAFDPFTFVAAGLDAGLGQLQNSFPGYGQGTQGYAKRFGASYADTFDGTMIGNALFPILLKQDPRYFRKGTGSFQSRLFYAIGTTARCKNDDGNWVPNYSNVLGNIAAGGISNLYYLPANRGVGLTFERAFTVTAEGALGAVFVEFWPDLSQKFFPNRCGEELP
jgi:hypothetical protein